MRLSLVYYLDQSSMNAVRKVQHALGEVTEAKASLELWLPHITVGDGIEVNDTELTAIKDSFETLSRNTPSI